MDLDFTPEEEAFRAKVRAFLKESSPGAFPTRSRPASA